MRRENGGGWWVEHMVGEHPSLCTGGEIFQFNVTFQCILMVHLINNFCWAGRVGDHGLINAPTQQYATTCGYLLCTVMSINWIDVNINGKCSLYHAHVLHLTLPSRGDSACNASKYIMINVVWSEQNLTLKARLGWGMGKISFHWRCSWCRNGYLKAAMVHKLQGIANSIPFHCSMGFQVLFFFLKKLTHLRSTRDKYPMSLGDQQAWFKNFFIIRTVLDSQSKQIFLDIR